MDFANRHSSLPVFEDDDLDRQVQELQSENERLLQAERRISTLLSSPPREQSEIHNVFKSPKEFYMGERTESSGKIKDLVIQISMLQGKLGRETHVIRDQRYSQLQQIIGDLRQLDDQFYNQREQFYRSFLIKMKENVQLRSRNLADLAAVAAPFSTPSTNTQQARSPDDVESSATPQSCILTLRRPFLRASITNPTAGEVYCAYWPNEDRHYAAVVLPYGDFESIKLPGSIVGSGLIHDDRRKSHDCDPGTGAYMWARGYEDGGSLEAYREVPVLFIDSGTFPRGAGYSWVPVNHLSDLDVTDMSLPYHKTVRKYIRDRQESGYVNNHGKFFAFVFCEILTYRGQAQSTTHRPCGGSPQAYMTRLMHTSNNGG
ncbi:hypothetical protein QQS21_007536 [Conoideocrella luteorostrata]|uniref:Uncharacterized protein n=1 Tax=Conoideocrella luteorostrata TaxID=1105319 RepID=A0AAJ0CMW7_9HYPO|nr:hypothetical protein QQS21_007536 [Conoideocrella luteorostrata]